MIQLIEADCQIHEKSVTESKVSGNVGTDAGGRKLELMLAMRLRDVLTNTVM